MADLRKALDLKSDGARELIKLTNSQFVLWGECIQSHTTEEIQAGNLMDYWFILSSLAMNPPLFQINKKDTYTCIPNLEPETVRKYVASVGRLGFVETVKSKNETYLRLTESGQQAVAVTLAHWLHAFSDIRRRHFAARRPGSLAAHELDDDGSG